MEFGIALDDCTDAVVRVAGLMKAGLSAEVGMRTGLTEGFDTGIGMLELLLW